MCIIREYVTMTGLMTEYVIGSYGARLVQIPVVQLGYCSACIEKPRTATYLYFDSVKTSKYPFY
jgi:hypothetical protein